MINAASAMNFAPMLSVPFTGAWVSARQTDKVVTVRAKIQDREGIPRIDTIDPCWHAARGWTDDVELQHSGYVQVQGLWAYLGRQAFYAAPDK